MNRSTVRKLRTKSHRGMKALAALLLVMALMMSLLPIAAMVSVEDANIAEAAGSVVESGDTSVPDASGESPEAEDPTAESAEIVDTAESPEAEAESADTGMPDASEESGDTDAPDVSAEPGETPESNPPVSQTMEDDTVITVEGVPEGIVMQGVPVSAEQTAALEAALDEMAAEKGSAVQSYAAFDITLKDAAGNEWQPPEGQSVRVTIQRPVTTPEGGETGIAHVDDAMTEATVVAKGTDTAEVEHFSIYVVYTLKEPGITVTFDVDEFGETRLSDVTVAPGETVTPPVLTDDLIPDGKALAGWVLDKGNPAAFDFANTAITAEMDGVEDGNVTFYAWFVPKTDVGNEGDLRAAVAAATESTVITLTDDITLTNDALDIPAGRDITLAGGKILTGTGGKSVITVSGRLTLNGITVTHLAGERGRGLTVTENAVLIMNGGVITGNAEAAGGGVSVGAGADFTLNDGSITGNRSTDAPKSDTRIHGGGVLVDGGSFTMLGGDITGNVAGDYDVQKYNPGEVNAGGVLLRNGSTFTMRAGNIIGNKGRTGVGGVLVDSSSFTMHGGSITGNQSKDEGGSSFETYIHGGGVLVDGGSFTMLGGDITENEGGDTDANWDDVRETNGGGVLLHNDSTFTMGKGSITNNKSRAGAGGVLIKTGSFTMSGGSINENSSRFHTGGVDVYEAEFKLSGGDIYGNKGHFSGGVSVVSDGTMIMSGGDIHKNVSGVGDGMPGLGGGITVDIRSRLEMSGGNIFSNETDSRGGGVFINGANSSKPGEGSSFIFSGGLIGDADPDDNNDTGNHAVNVGGGGVYVGRGSALTITGSARIAGNTAKDGGGVYGYGKIEMENGEIYGNRAANGGGGVHAAHESTFAVSGGSIYGNTAKNGGGVYVDSDYSTPRYVFWHTGGDISANKAATNGAGLYIEGGLAELNSDITGNETAANGGGVYINAGGGKLTGDITGNKAATNGGGVYINAGEVTLTGDITENEAATHGGGICIITRECRVVMDGGSISGNKAMKGNGGGVYSIAHDNTEAVMFTLNRGSISDNKAEKGDGGGVYVNSYYNEIITGEEAVFSGNIAKDSRDYGMGRAGDYPNIRWKGDNSIKGTHLLNNYDINNRSIPIYTVKYDANGGEGSMASQTVNPGNELVVKINEFTRAGYIFDKWNTSADGSGESFRHLHTFDSWDRTGDLTLYAQWKESAVTAYTVTFDKNGGDTEANPGIKTVTRPKTTVETLPAAPTRSGHIFAGWNTKAGGEGTVFTAATEVTGNITVYAQWEQNASVYTVRFIDWNGAEISSQQVAHGNNLTVPGNPSRDGYTFSGWSPAVVTVVTANATYTAVYTAVPDPVTYTVTYAPGLHGTFGTQTTSGLTAGAATPAAPGITGDAGWSFTGWSPVPTETVTGSVTYTAQWAEDTIPAPDPEDPVTFTVTFVNWDGAVLKTEQVAAGGNATAPGNPSRAGYTFNGWDRGFTNVQSNITVTAQYTENPVTVTEEEPDPTPPGDAEDPTPDEVLEALTGEGVQSVTIGDQEVPLSAGSLTQFVWALLNLILMVAGVILGVVFFLRKKREDGDEEETYLYEAEERQEKRKRTRLIWSVVAIVMAVAGVVVFLLTEDITRLMVLTDNWTIVNALILMAEITGMILASKRQKARDNEEQQA